MLRIDAHQHFWTYEPVRDIWIDSTMKILRRNYLPTHLEPILAENNFAGTVTIQSDSSEAENQFQLKNASEHAFILGIVGWVDFMKDNIGDRLDYYSEFDKIKGFRHILQQEAQRNFMLNSKFMQGIKLLEKYDLTYDILILPDQLQYIPEFVSAFPKQRFVIDHLAKPDIKGQTINDWKKDILKLSEFENLSCKISGMVTEASLNAWQQHDFDPYLDVIISCFGIDRILYGSDWPVSNLSATYTQVLNIVETYFSSFSNSEKEKIFNLNAARFYKL